MNRFSVSVADLSSQRRHWWWHSLAKVGTSSCMGVNWNACMWRKLLRVFHSALLRWGHLPQLYHHSRASIAYFCVTELLPTPGVPPQQHWISGSGHLTPLLVCLVLLWRLLRHILFVLALVTTTKDYSEPMLREGVSRTWKRKLCSPLQLWLGIPGSRLNDFRAEDRESASSVSSVPCRPRTGTQVHLSVWINLDEAAQHLFASQKEEAHFLISAQEHYLQLSAVFFWRFQWRTQRLVDLDWTLSKPHPAP